MPTITFMNSAPVAGLIYNPGLEEVLDPTGTITASTANLFEIRASAWMHLKEFLIVSIGRTNLPSSPLLSHNRREKVGRWAQHRADAVTVASVQNLSAFRQLERAMPSFTTKTS